MMAKINGTAVACAAVGVAFVYTGAQGYSLLTGVANIVKGKSFSVDNPVSSLTDSSTTGGTAAEGSDPAGINGGGTSSQNIVLGQKMAAQMGWKGNEWLCLKTGWSEESNWSTTAANVPSDPYNHAYGIPQANPGTKMASAGADWKTNAATQIRWGLSYIKGTYGSPSRVPHWSPNGPTAGYVGY